MPTTWFNLLQIFSLYLQFLRSDNANFEINNAKNLEHVTSIFFNQRRKMIKRPMKYLFKNFEEISKELSIDLKLRPQNLDNLTYYKICKFYENQLMR